MKFLTISIIPGTFISYSTISFTDRNIQQEDQNLTQTLDLIFYQSKKEFVLLLYSFSGRQVYTFQFKIFFNSTKLWKTVNLAKYLESEYSPWFLLNFFRKLILHHFQRKMSFPSFWNSMDSENPSTSLKQANIGTFTVFNHSELRKNLDWCQYSKTSRKREAGLWATNNSVRCMFEL